MSTKCGCGRAGGRTCRTRRTPTRGRVSCDWPSSDAAPWRRSWNIVAWKAISWIESHRRPISCRQDWSRWPSPPSSPIGRPTSASPSSIFRSVLDREPTNLFMSRDSLSLCVDCWPRPADKCVLPESDTIWLTRFYSVGFSFLSFLFLIISDTLNGTDTGGAESRRAPTHSRRAGATEAYDVHDERASSASASGRSRSHPTGILFERRRFPGASINAQNKNPKISFVCLRDGLWLFPAPASR